MFLLSKLGGVSGLFTEDVARIREFLLDRGIPAGSLAALTHFSGRLAIDPSFQRDVTSLVQVVIRREDEAVDYMDLLGILVVAAAGAGPFHASDEQEESVREILRFLTQIRRPTGAVGPVFVRSQNVIPVVVAAEALPGERAAMPVPGSHDVPVRPVSSVPFYRLEDLEPSRGRGAAVWIAGAMALAVALGSGWMLYHKGHAAPQTTAVLQIVPSPNLPVHDSNERTTEPVRRVQRSRAPVIRRPAPTAGRSGALPGKPRTAEDASTVGSQRPLDAGRSFPPANSASPAKPDVIAGSAPVTRPLNAGPESAATSTPPVNTATSSAPSVRRRLPKSIMLNPPPPRLSAERLNAAAPGVVHPASLGMMASNLISSPAPAYPAAASQALVQGEVRVRAVVDRDGNVIDARVVSGPELLRDVSLEAVQRWRFRPYMQGGKPVEVATTAILDFELP
ncbi:energy transducer TonB [Granulicella arctica]|uniref:energy transducer TonB n=1 Tax=Granulicella arctica TaxID=940613 RepID=UPI0021DF6B52|nr:TonB family protein [Granulicella arctica]